MLSARMLCDYNASENRRELLLGMEMIFSFSYFL
jgi:hypothetical protein